MNINDEETEEIECPFLERSDNRQSIHIPNNELVHDVVRYEDVSCRDFLEASTWHIVIYVGEQGYAYHRKHLEDYFDQHCFIHPFMGMVVDTPHFQTLDHPSKMMLKWSDYSIVKLIPSYQTMVKKFENRHNQHTPYNIKKNMYECHFFTIDRWITNKDEPDTIYKPPSEEYMNNHINFLLFDDIDNIDDFDNTQNDDYNTATYNITTALCVVFIIPYIYYILCLQINILLMLIWNEVITSHRPAELCELLWNLVYWSSPMLYEGLLYISHILWNNLHITFI